MRRSITQESDFGCGVACFAFVLGVSYQQAVKLLGRERSVKHGWRPSDLVSELGKHGFAYRNKYFPKLKHTGDFPNGTIVLIERSNYYPVGHYLVRHNGFWMDPWINLPFDQDVKKALSGFRKRLPSKPMYAILAKS